MVLLSQYFFHPHIIIIFKNKKVDFLTKINKKKKKHILRKKERFKQKHTHTLLLLCVRIFLVFFVCLLFLQSIFYLLLLVYLNFFKNKNKIHFYHQF